MCQIHFFPFFSSNHFEKSKSIHPSAALQEIEIGSKVKKKKKVLKFLRSISWLYTIWQHITVCNVCKYSVPCMHNQVLPRNSGKKCDKTMKSTLFIRAPMIAACPSFLASSGFTIQIIKFRDNTRAFNVYVNR